MIGSLDFSLGTVIGIVVGVIAGFVANYLTEVFRGKKRHKRVVKAFIRELIMIRDDIKLGTPYKSAVVGTPVFSKLVTELPLLRDSTAEELLNTYSDIKFYLRPNGGATTDDLKEVAEAIETSIRLLGEEVERSPWHHNKRVIS